MCASSVLTTAGRHGGCRLHRASIVPVCATPSLRLVEIGPEESSSAVRNQVRQLRVDEHTIVHDKPAGDGDRDVRQHRIGVDGEGSNADGETAKRPFSFQKFARERCPGIVADTKMLDLAGVISEPTIQHPDHLSGSADSNNSSPLDLEDHRGFQGADFSWGPEVTIHYDRTLDALHDPPKSQ
jgi:hypothetical protein